MTCIDHAVALTLALYVPAAGPAAAQPPWRIHLAGECEGGSVLLCRFHHSLADGFGLLFVMLSLTDGDDEVPRMTAASSGGLWRRGWQRFLSTAWSAWHLLFFQRETASLLRRPLGHEKRMAWSQPIPLEDIKHLGKDTGATVNDVLMTAVSGALRRYLAERGEAVDRLRLRSIVPVNLRGQDEMRNLGNRVGLVFLELPVAAGEPAERRRLVKARMDRLKHSAEAWIVSALFEIVGRAPDLVQRLAARYFASKVTLVVTNVPGPRRRRTLAGREIRTIMFWVPQTGDVGIGISVFSYAGEVRIGVAADAGLVADPKILIDAFQAELRVVAHHGSIAR